MSGSTSTQGDLRALVEGLKNWHPVYPASRFKGRGIVVCAGGVNLFTNAYVLIWVLRKTLGCTLPIEVWHFGPEEMSLSMASLLAELDAQVVNALPLIAAAGSRTVDGWQLIFSDPALPFRGSLAA